MTQEDPTTRRDIIQEMQKKRNILLGNCSAERNKIFNLVAIRFGQNR
jgi:predicted nucleic acid-binding Zn ribbon protein